MMKTRLTARRLCLLLAATASIALAACSSSTPGEAPDNPDTPDTPVVPDTPGDAIVVVAADGTGDYTSLQAAFDALPRDGQRHVVYLRAGLYEEKVRLRSGHDDTILVGEDAATTILSWDDYAGRIDPSTGEALGTSGSYTLSIESDDFQASGITVRNTHVNRADAPTDSQAVAVRVYADRAAFHDCRITGYQDTFLGWNGGRIYVADSYIEGNVDFIFGSSVMLFDRCTLFCNRHDSVLTAAATPDGYRFGIVFRDCRIDHIEGNDFNGRAFTRFHLGRPWQNKPQTVFIRCYEPATLAPAGWRSMSVDAALYAEYACTGDGAAPDRLAQREMGGRQLSDDEAAEYTLANIFSARTAPAFAQDWTPEAPYRLPDGL